MSVLHTPRYEYFYTYPHRRHSATVSITSHTFSALKSSGSASRWVRRSARVFLTAILARREPLETWYICVCMYARSHPRELKEHEAERREKKSLRVRLLGWRRGCRWIVRMIGTVWDEKLFVIIFIERKNCICECCFMWYWMVNESIHFY